MQVVVDIGSNTLKFLAARIEKDSFELIAQGSWTPRLGHQLDQNGILSEESLKKAHEALLEIQNFVTQHQPTSLKVVATAAAREARNSDALSKMVKNILGVPLWILSGNQEAELSQKGAQKAIERAQNWLEQKTISVTPQEILYIDMGGASTEIIRREIFQKSFRIGVVRLFEATQSTPSLEDRWTEKEMFLAKNFLEKVFSPQEFQAFEKSPQKIQLACAIGGTLVALVRALPETEIIQPGIYFTRHEPLLNFEKNFIGSTAKDRIEKFRIPPQRADVAPCGLFLLNQILQRFNLKNVVVTEWGLRHGILFTDFLG